MKEIQVKYAVRIPSNITVFYCDQKKIITLKGPLGKKSLKLKVKISIKELEKMIKVSPTAFTKISNNQKKKIKTLQGTTVALIKQLIVETSSVLYQRIKFVGVGYRAFDVDNYKNKLLLFKLGFSHPIYFRTILSSYDTLY